MLFPSGKNITFVACCIRRLLAEQSSNRNLPQFLMNSITERVLFSILIAVACIPGIAQSAEPDDARVYFEIHDATERALASDALLQNGLYYAYPYFNAVGHPFLGDGEFGTGSVVFREKSYEGITINYDIFNQQIILSRKLDEMLQMNLLANEFISGFSFQGKHFIKASFEGESSPFFQIISQNPYISCYYSWYKERHEALDSRNRQILSFSEQKSKHYLLLDGKLLRYNNNRAFVRLLPDAAKVEIKKYLKVNKVLVNDANEEVMRSLIEYCNTMLGISLNQKGE